MASGSKRTKYAEEIHDTTGPNWLELPRDLTAKILKSLTVVEILMKARQVCSLWWNICKDPLMWRTIVMSNRGTLTCRTYENICRYAIHLSRGQLQDYSVYQFGDSALLKYITQSTSQLRRLQLTSCWGLSDRNLSEVADKFPLLEELVISHSFLSKDSLEAIGQCCPNLIVLKFNKLGGPLEKCNDEAFVIAKTMPKLRHLQLWGNMLTNDGVLAILDACHHLESLDLQSCFFVYLRGGSLKKRCEEQVKVLIYDDKRPYEDEALEAIEDYLYYSYGNYNDYVIYDSDYEAYAPEMAYDEFQLK